MIIALAGRRIDAPKAESVRFPAENVSLVAQRIETELQKLNATMLVSAAACGADLIALEVAGRLGLRRRVVLPFAVEEFRRTSVVDRPGEWGSIYDRVVKEADLVQLGFSPDDDEVYQKANIAILENATAHGRTTAVVVWDELSRGPGDVTEHFRTEAKRRALAVVDISTLRAG